MHSVAKFFAAALLLTGLLLLAAPKAAGQNSIVTAFVTDSQGRPIAGEGVNLYDGPGKCKCANNQCAVDPLDSKITGRNGRAMFMRLMNDHSYTVCVDDRCQTVNQCANPQNDCQFFGFCQTTVTQKHGGNVLVQIIHP